MLCYITKHNPIYYVTLYNEKYHIIFVFYSKKNIRCVIYDFYIEFIYLFIFIIKSMQKATLVINLCLHFVIHQHISLKIFHCSFHFYNI